MKILQSLVGIYALTLLISSLVFHAKATVQGNIKDGNNSLIATDSYRRYKEDIKLLKDLGVDSYRFSISWSRILPKGSLCGGINQEGIDFYNNLINEVIANGMKPFVTILHFDTPQALEDKYGGFLGRPIVDDFKDYSELLFKTYGDRVKHWITINEPFVVALGYDLGKGAPGRCSLPPPVGPCPAVGNSSTEPYIVSHNFILAHAAAAKLYKAKYQKIQGGEIGIVVVGEFMEPLTDTEDDKEAAIRYMDFLFGWYLEPLIFGDYPQIMRDYVQERLPIFTIEEKRLIRGSLDFIGVNYYTSRYAYKSQPVEPKHYIGDSLATITTLKDGVLIGPKARNRYVYSYPIGLQKLLEYMNIKYRNPVIYITENGYPDANVPDRPLQDSLSDQVRIDYITQHLYYTKEAINLRVFPPTDHADYLARHNHPLAVVRRLHRPLFLPGQGSIPYCNAHFQASIGSFTPNGLMALILQMHTRSLRIDDTTLRPQQKCFQSMLCPQLTLHRKTSRRSPSEISRGQASLSVGVL
uniref:Uncharacterized protein n=1 Tax=Cannabis sativa TaxID=3483 RepID=A0A803P8B4_CANSA